VLAVVGLVAVALGGLALVLLVVSQRATTEAQRAQDKATREADHAQESERKARDEADIAEAVNDFLQKDLLGQADSRNQAERQFKPDPDVKVRYWARIVLILT
jgi:hypothetical protein